MTKLVNISSGVVLSDQSVLDAAELGGKVKGEAKENNSDIIVPPEISTFSSRKKSVLTKSNQKQL